MNVSQKVAALEALLEKVQRNAALPRPGRGALLDAAPVNSPLAPEPDAAALLRASPPSPTAPYPVIGPPHAAPPPPPPVEVIELAPLVPAASAEPKEVALPSYTALHAIDMEPSSYPTLPGIAVPMQKSAAQPSAGPLPKVPPVVAPSPKPPVTADAPKQAAALATTKIQAPAVTTKAPVKAPEPVAAKPAATAVAKAPAATTAKPEVTASPKPEVKAATSKSPVAPPVVAKPAARTPSMLAGKTLLGGVSPVLPKAPTTASPSLPKAPELTTPAAKAAPEPSAAATKSPVVVAPPEARAPAAPVAPVAPVAPATAKPAESDDIELPDDWGAEKPRELPGLVDEATGEFVVPAQVSAAVAAKDAKAKPATPAATAPSGLPKGVVDDESEESGDEPTVLRASPREEIEKIISSRAESSEEPTMLRKAPDEPPPSESEDSAEEPTMIRHSTADAAEAAKQAGEQAAEPPKRSEEPTNRNIRVALSPDLIAQAAAELEAKVERQERAPGSDEVTSLTKAPSELIAPPSEATVVGRPARPPRTASIWGLFAASLVLIAGGVIVAKQKGWIPGGLPWDPPPVVSTVGDAPTAPPSPTPSVVETASTTAALLAPSAAPVADLADAGAMLDASAADASAADASAADAGDAGSIDAGGAADAGSAVDAGGAVDAGATADVAAPPSGDGAPPKDPKSLPDKKGYLKVTTPGALHVFVTGTHAGLTNEWLELDCGLKFLRIGELPPGAAPAPGNAGVKWRSPGQPTAVPCKGQLEVPITPSP